MGLRAAGQQYAALAIAGYTPSIVGNTEEYNGSVWSEVNDLQTARKWYAAGGTFGDAFAAGGDPAGVVAKTEEWNGVTWSEHSEMISGRRRLAGAGTRAAGLAISGDSPGHALTEEYAGSGIYKTLKICAITGSQA